MSSRRTRTLLTRSLAATIIVSGIVLLARARTPILRWLFYEPIQRGTLWNGSSYICYEPSTPSSRPAILVVDEPNGRRREIRLPPHRKVHDSDRNLIVQVRLELEGSTIWVDLPRLPDLPNRRTTTPPREEL